MGSCLLFVHRRSPISKEDYPTVQFVLLLDSLHQAYFFVYEGVVDNGVIRVAEKSAIQRIKELDEERAAIFDQAREEALQKATQAVAELNALGLNYRLANGDGKKLKKSKAASANSNGPTKDAACPVCDFATSPAHDGRSHRNQPKKRPFTAAELAEKNLIKIE
jgi:hypothetical protein